MSEPLDLGPLVRHFARVSWTGVFLRWLRRWSPLAALGLVVLGLYKLSGSTSVWAGTIWARAWILVGVAALMLVASIALRPRVSLDVHERGVRYRELWSSTELLWSQTRLRARFLGYATVGGRIEERYAYGLRAKGGIWIALDWRFADAAALATLVVERTEALAMDRITAAVAGGGSADCGADLQLTPDGVSDGRVTAGWQEIQSIEVSQGILKIFPGFARRYADVDDPGAVVTSMRMLVERHAPVKAPAYR
jgi:hypothetical protein